MDILIAECRKDREKELQARTGRAKTKSKKKDPNAPQISLGDLDLDKLGL